MCICLRTETQSTRFQGTHLRSSQIDPEGEADSRVGLCLINPSQSLKRGWAAKELGTFCQVVGSAQSDVPPVLLGIA